MSLANIAYNPVLTWANPLMTKLENQALVPIFGEHPVEMGMVGREKQILAMLRDDAKYRQMFTDAFKNDKYPINLSNLTKALAAFQRSLISVNSPYDKYRFGGDTNAISPAAKRGEKLFNSEDLECFHLFLFPVTCSQFPSSFRDEMPVRGSRCCYSLSRSLITVL